MAGMTDGGAPEQQPGHPAGPPPGRRFGFLISALAIALAAGLGLWVQIGERVALDTRYRVPSAAPDRVDIEATVQRVDAANRDLTLRVLVVPRGALADPDGLAPAADLVIQTSQSVRGDISHRAHERIASTDLAVALNGGAIVDHPFDAYDTEIDFTAQSGGRTVPVNVSLTNADGLFAVRADTETVGATAVYSLSVARSNSVLLFTVFMMAAMWALAIAVVIATRHLVRHRKGLTWPALGWMAATLFALAAFRNTAPGNPPIGSILDYAAFLWCEAVVAVCLIIAVVAGNRVEGDPERRP